MEGGLGHTSFEMSNWGFCSAVCCASASAFFFFLSPKAELGEANARARTIRATIAWPLRIGFRVSACISVSSQPLLRHFDPVLVTRIAECHVAGLVLHQQSLLSGRVGLMTGQAGKRTLNLGGVLRVQKILDRVSLDRMAAAILQRQDRDPVLLIVVLGQLHFSVEDGQHMLGLEPLWLRVGPGALQAEGVSLGAQQMIVVAAVRLVTGRAALDKGRLMEHALLGLLGLVSVAAQADIDRVRFGKPRLPAGVGAVAVRAVARRAGMRNFGSVDELGFIVVAGHAK